MTPGMPLSRSPTRTAIERSGMKKLLAYVEPGDTVVVWRVDRLGRSLIDVLNMVKLLREREVHLKSISDRFDPATTSGRLMLKCSRLWPNTRGH